MWPVPEYSPPLPWQILTHGTIEVRHFVSEYPPFTSSRHVRLNPRIDSEKKQLSWIEQTQWPRYTTKIVPKKSEILTILGQGAP